MKKNLVLFLSVMTIGLLCTSCSKDDAPQEEASLIGKWEYFKEGTIVNSVETLENYEHSSGCTKDNLEYKTNNNYSDILYENSPTTNCDESIYNATFSKSGNVITITHPSETFTQTILSLTSTELKIQEGQTIYLLKKI